MNLHAITITTRSLPCRASAWPEENGRFAGIKLDLERVDGCRVILSQLAGKRTLRIPHMLDLNSARANRLYPIIAEKSTGAERRSQAAPRAVYCRLGICYNRRRDWQIVSWTEIVRFESGVATNGNRGVERRAPNPLYFLHRTPATRFGSRSRLGIITRSSLLSVESCMPGTIDTPA